MYQCITGLAAAHPARSQDEEKELGNEEEEERGEGINEERGAVRGASIKGAVTAGDGPLAQGASLDLARALLAEVEVPTRSEGDAPGPL